MILLSFLAGLSCKLYDDLDDNIFLKKFKNDKFMEFLKGIHYIAFTAISIDEPVFFILQYIFNFLQKLTNKEGYKKPYESSVFYSFLLLLFIIDYKNISWFNKYETLLILFLCLSCFIEPIVSSRYLEHDKEVSKNKLQFRICLLLPIFVILYFINSTALKYTLVYCIAYMLLSAIIQYYSLFITKNTQNETENEIENEIENELENEVNS